MRAFDGPYARALRAEAVIVSTARLRGHLYEVDGYPGAVHDPAAPTWVHGELYRLPADLTPLLTRLDAYEGRDYERRVCPVETTAGTVSAWTYAYVAPTHTLIRYPNGRFPAPPFRPGART